MTRRTRDEGEDCPIGKCKARGFHFREEAVQNGQPMTNWHCPDGSSHLLPREWKPEEERPAKK